MGGAALVADAAELLTVMEAAQVSGVTRDIISS